jgi:molybdopterin converting factor small subunit
MVRITFPAVLERHVACPPLEVDGATVRAALEAAFANRPDLRSYVLDDQGALRQHMALFVNGAPLRDRRTLSDAIAPGTAIAILQALSGG